jgi:tetratricopeptide (TPR) repeat protein
MKLQLGMAISAITLASVPPLVAQQALQLQAMIVKPTGERVGTGGRVFVEKIENGLIWFRIRDTAPEITSAPIKAQKAIYVSRPADFIEAVELFENRKYELALPKFQEVIKKYSKFSDIENSFPALAGLYELACYRNLKQYDKLAEAEKVFAREKWLTKESDRAQIGIYKLWVMLRDKENYQRIVKEYKEEWRTRKLPNSLRAQVEFVYGKAQEGLGENGEALIAYMKALTADFASSEVISQEALSASFNLIENDKEAQEVRRVWDKGEKDLMEPKVNTMPYFRLLEASALVRVHNLLALSGFDENGTPIKLPEKFTAYLKYTQEEGNKFLSK